MASLCLGTVQFGMKYGVNNLFGQPTYKQSFEMIDLALEKGINIIDTAGAYGEAEKILGSYFASRKNFDKFKIISKLRPNCIDPGQKASEIIEKEFLNSLKLLGVDFLDGYMLHTPEYIYRQDILDGLQRLKEKKLVNNIGISIYDIKEGLAAVKSGMVDYVQIPYSILDQRGLRDGFFEMAKKAGMTIFARSAFLQGLFMMEPERIPKNLQQVTPFMEIFENLLIKYGIKKVDALIHFVVDEENIDYLVFGVDNKNQLLEDISSFKDVVIPPEFISEIKQKIGTIDKSIIFPSLWSNGKKAE